MSLLGSYKARITKAAKALREKIAEVDEATLQPLDPTAEASKDPHFILSHKSSLFLRLTLIERAVEHLRAQREKAEEFARQNPDEQGESPFLQQIQSHWDAGELDRLVEEADTLHARLDIAIKLLPSSEALYSIRSSVVPSSLSSVHLSPHLTQDPIPTVQPAQDVRVEIASHPSSNDQDRPSDPDAIAPADTLPPRAASATQGFGVSPNHPPTFGNPFVTSSCPLPNPFVVSSTAPNPTSSQSSVDQSLKLPSFEIPTFHGDIDRFYEFWDLFSTAVHNNTSVPVPVKFMYLKSHLRGPAASIIAGFQSTAENYDEAVRILNNTYGRPEILRNKLWDKLLQLPSASDSPFSQRATLCAIRATWTQLQHLKEDSSAIGTLKIIRAKFPRRTRERIGEFKNKGDSMWTVDELLATLDTIIDRLENIEDADPSDYHSYNSQSAVRQYSPSPRRYPRETRTGGAFTRYRTPSRARRSTSRTPSPRNRRDRPPTPYYPRRSSYSPSRSRYESSDQQCVFCHNFGHPSDRCRSFDAKQRRLFVSRNRLCWLCLQPGHTYMYCDAPLCPYCNRIHHRSLCLEVSSFPRSPTPTSRQAFYQDSHRSRSPRHVQFHQEAYGSSSRVRSRTPRASSRGFQSRSPSPSRNRFSPTPSRRTSPAYRSRSPTSAVHSTNCTFDTSRTTMDTQAELSDDQSRASGAHSPSSCTSVCYGQPTPQEPRLMVVHAVTKNFKTQTSELLTVFLDSGSQYSFICTALAKHLGLAFKNTRTVTTLTFGGHELTEESSEVILTLWDQNDYPIRLELWTREKITTVPRTNGRIDTTIVDPGDRVDVDVLLGIDNYWRVVDLHRNERLPSGLILSHTRFGPVLSGIQHPVVSNSLSTIHRSSDEDEPESDRLIRSLFGLDTLGLDEGEDVENADVIRQFYKKVAIVDGSIYVSFPWKLEHPPLEDNKPLAFRRLQSQYEKFRATPEAWKDYCNTIEDQLRIGIIEDVTDVAAQGSNTYYIPHQAVYKQNSSTTKLRIVFDASSHQKGCPSLNDCLYQGPSLLPDLVGTLMRSRFHRFLIIADVEKAFHQIHLHQDQRDSTRFLWLKDVQQPPTTDNLRILRFTRVPFGINASPFLLSMSIRYFLEQDPANRLKEEILANTYVDNLIVGAGSNNECLDKCKQCKEIFARMSMNLREFMSNSKSTMRSIPEHDRMIIPGPFAKFLGIKWNPTLDVLHVPINIACQSVTSKRTALRVYASTFDPLGLLTPLLIRPKMFIQDLWESGYDWDDPLTEADIEKWNTIVQEISSFHSQVPRYLGVTCDDVYDLVLCSDASKRVFATAVYILTRHPNNPRPTLVFAKAKVAPPGAITIPRMELLACHMAAKTAKFLKTQCKVSFHSVRFFTDSQIVLYWIQSRKPLKTYVTNRVRYIRRVLDELRADNIATGFYYLNTDNNPADCATRGLTAAELQDHMWWTGPSFFSTPSSQWPWKSLELSVSSLPGAEAEELKAVTIPTNTISESYVSFVPFARTKSYTKLVRITAYVLKFLAKARHRVSARCQREHQDLQSIFGTMDTTPIVTPHDFTRAESLLIREHYREGQQQLNSSYMKKFRTTYDEDGLIRVDWRMSNAQTDNSTNPILILSDHPLCEMLIMYHHCQLFHAGPSHLITTLRKSFFIPRLKRLVKSVLSKCVICRRYQARPYKYPYAPDLPSQRVTRSRPFQHIGLDYFGPILVRLQSSERHKVWICLFTCMSTRALHLEVVRDNSTLQFILAFRRFMARRGKPDTVTCDNAPTFKLGQEIIKNELPAVTDDSQMNQFCASHNINWTFITPYSPWKGGFYERLVGSVKTALKKTVRNQILDIWLLETLIIEIEAILNTRPLFPVNSADPDTNVVIRPIDLITSDFQVARLTGIIPQKIANASGESYRALRTRYKSLQEDLDHFWQLWQNEYLDALAQRQIRCSNGQSSKKPPRVGEVVLVRQDAHRSTWPLALILELHTSSDGNVRSAKIRTAKRKILERSINQLVPLEVVVDDKTILDGDHEEHLAEKDTSGTSKE